MLIDFLIISNRFSGEFDTVFYIHDCKAFHQSWRLTKSKTFSDTILIKDNRTVNGNLLIFKAYLANF